MTFFVAFYSYKGGVGRTLALANLGYSLAARGKRVVLVDMDLEAPAVHGFPEFAVRGKGEKKGIVEYAASYGRRGKSPSIKRYAYPCRKSPGSGKLWLMPAGRFGDRYQETLSGLNWRRLHPKKGTQPFIEGLRRDLTETFAPHYVLIDARTGLSDVGGISTHLLADMVVLVFNLTRGCIEGSVRAYRSITAEGTRVGAIQLVAGPVPQVASGGESPVDRRLRQAGELMPLGTSYGREIIRIDYDPAMVLAEELAVRKPEIFRAAASYEKLRDAVQRANPSEVFPFVEEARKRRSEGRLEKGLEILEAFVESHPDNAEGLLELGSFLLESQRAGEAVRRFRRAIEIAPELPVLHHRLGEALLATGAAEEAAECLNRAVELGVKGPEVFEALAESYSGLGETARQSEARRRALIAILGSASVPADRRRKPEELRAEFVSVLGRNPPFMAFQAESFWDLLMGSLDLSPEEKYRIARTLLEGQLAIPQITGLVRILEEEKEKWLESFGPSAATLQKRVASTPVPLSDLDALLALRQGDLADAALLCFAALKQSGNLGKRAELLLEADGIDPGNHFTLFMLGHVHGELADLQEGEPRQALLEQACGHYEEAVKHKPDKHEALYNWGIALRKLADLQVGEPRQALLEQACGRYEEAVKHKPGLHEALFNLACTMSLLGRFDEAAALVAAELLRRPDMRAHALDDTDLEPIWSRFPDFREAIRRSLAAGDDVEPIEKWRSETATDG